MKFLNVTMSFFLVGSCCFANSKIEKAKTIYKQRMKVEEKRHKKACDELLQRLSKSYTSEIKSAMARGKLGEANKLNEELALIKKGQGKNVEVGTTLVNVDINNKENVRDNIMVLCRGQQKQITLSKMPFGKNYFEKWDKKKDVYMVHPFSVAEPSITDFSKVTKGNKGAVHLTLRNHPGADTLVKVFVDGEEFKTILAKDDKWINVRIPFDHQSVTLEGHAGGLSEWRYEMLYFTYRVSKFL